MMQTILIDGVDTRDYGVSVTKIKGAFDMPARYGTYQRDWKDVDGIEAFVQIDDLYFSQRKITLECVMEAENISTFQFNLGQFRELVYKKIQLTTPYSSHTCVLKQGAKVRWINDKYGNDVVARFTLVFNEITYDFGQTLIGNPNISNDVFWIDNIALSEFGIVVENADGYFDFPKMKTDKVTRYRRESDKVNKREARQIDLKCSLIATDINDLLDKVTKFHALLAKEGLRKLMIPLPGLEKPFEVFNSKGFTVKSVVQNETQIVISFMVEFIEPSPMPESFFLTMLLDTDGVPILTTGGEYIYIIADRKDITNPNTYLFTDGEQQEKTYLWTTNELDINDALYNALSEEVYLFTDEEIGKL